MLGAAIALAVSGSQLIYTVFPWLKPDPRDSVLAQVSVFAIDPNVSLGDYITRAYGSIARAPKALQIPPADRAFPGDVVYVRTRVDGFKHRQVRVMATIYVARTQQRFAPPGEPTSALSARKVTLDAEHEHRPAPVDHQPRQRAGSVRAHRNVRRHKDARGRR